MLTVNVRSPIMSLYKRAKRINIMSTSNLIKTIQKELEKLNSEIDVKIIKGFSYKKESQRHKFLSAQLAVLTRPAQRFDMNIARRSIYGGWLRRASRAIASFTL